MKHGITALLAALCIPALQASNDTQTLLDSQRVFDVMRFTVNGSTVAYRIDNLRSGVLHEQGATFVAPGAVDLTYHLFNPFKITISSSESTVADPVQKALSDFASALTGTSKAIVPASGGAAPPVNTPKGQDCSKITTAVSHVNLGLEKIRKDIPVADDLAAWVDEATALAGIQAAHKQIANKRKLLNDDITEAQNDRKTLDDEVKVAPQCALSFGEAGILNDFPAKLETGKQMVRSLDGLITLLTGFEKRSWRTSESSNDDLVINTTETDPAQMKNVKLTFQPTKYSIDSATNSITSTNDPAIDRTITIRRLRTAVPEYGVAAIFNNLRYPKYSVKDQNGTNVVAREFDKSNVNAAATLNLLCNCFGGSGLYPGIQFGVSKTQDYPGILLGGVLRFEGETHIAVGAGGMITWFKDLSTLNVGGPVESDSALKADLKLRMSRPAFYLGAQYTF
jgi:hypothetical protein